MKMSTMHTFKILSNSSKAASRLLILRKLTLIKMQECGQWEHQLRSASGKMALVMMKSSKFLYAMH